MFFKIISRTFEIGKLIATISIRRGLRPEVKFRIFFEEAGGAFTKLGQILALRYDLIPPAYAAELHNLLANVKAVSFSEMEEVFIREQGRSLNQVFVSIDEVPIASASISQVYLAELPSGEKVALKIARPGVGEDFARDFALARYLARLAGLFGFLNADNLKTAVEDFISWTREELDFQRELANAQALASNLKESSQTIIPTYYPELSGSSVLVSSYLADIRKLDQVIGNAEGRQGLDLPRLSHNYVFDLMRQYFIDGCFHADPHPGNVFFTQGGQLGYFDFGIVGRAGPERYALQKIMRAIANHDLWQASSLLLEFAKSTISAEIKMMKVQDLNTYERYQVVIDKVEEIIRDNLRSDLEEIFAPWYERHRGQTTKPVPPTTMLKDFVNQLARHQVNLLPNMTIFFRLLVIADTVALRLNPEFDMLGVMKNFFAAHPEPETPWVRAQAEPAVSDQTHLSYEQLIELKAQERERAFAVREKLIDLVGLYAEDYEEVRKLLRGKLA